MNYEEKKKRLNELWITLLANGTVSNKKELSEKLGIAYSTITNAFSNDEKSLSLNMLRKMEQLLQESDPHREVISKVTQVPLLPIEARGGSLGEYSEGVLPYQCELIQSPIKGAQFAIQVAGDSMSPDYPSGCHVFIKNQAVTGSSSSLYLPWRLA